MEFDDGIPSPGDQRHVWVKRQMINRRGNFYIQKLAKRFQDYNKLDNKREERERRGEKREERGMEGEREGKEGEKGETVRRRGKGCGHQ